MQDEDKGSYKNLIVWQKSIVLVKQIYHLTRKFPADEKFGLISQMRRAVVSIPSNIAEGQARKQRAIIFVLSRLLKALWLNSKLNL